MSILIEKLQKGPIRQCYLFVEKLCSVIPDEIYLKIVFRLRVGKKLNLDNPQTLNDKLNWLKLHDRNPQYTTMVDKLLAKEYVANKIGAEHVIPLLGAWDDYDSIEFEHLPEQFVLKCNHTSGCFVICKDKNQFDHKRARKILGEGLRRDYSLGGREWPYKDVKRKIIAEPYIDSLGKQGAVEYKLTCFNGELAFTTICKGIAHSKLCERTNDFYDRDFKQLPFWAYYRHSDDPITKTPKELGEMISLAELLSEGIPYTRVDFYLHEGRIYFGEITFFTWGGFLKFEPEEWDFKLGQMLELPKMK